jgi:hypothetical protein
LVLIKLSTPRRGRAFLRKLHLGYCQYGGEGIERVGRDRYLRVSRKPTISLFALFVEAADESMVRSVILHEVAHALAGRDHKHDRMFKQTMNNIGGTFCLTWEEWERIAPAIVQRMNRAEKQNDALLPLFSPGTTS